MTGKLPYKSTLQIKTKSASIIRDENYKSQGLFPLPDCLMLHLRLMEINYCVFTQFLPHTVTSEEKGKLAVCNRLFLDLQKNKIPTPFTCLKFVRLKMQSQRKWLVIPSSQLSVSL